MPDDITKDIFSLRKIQETISQSAVTGTLILVDLVNSTEYKTRNGEDAWLSRLLDFYKTVKRGLDPLVPVKYLGDGILGFYPDKEVKPNDFIDISKKILKEIEHINSKRRYTPEHEIRVRIVLGYGRVFLFEGKDPQGTVVDKLFRMEKYVPENCIGMIEEFHVSTKHENAYLIGRYSLKGLAGGRHRLYILGQPEESSKHGIENAKRRAALNDIWDLGVANVGKICLISGYIPPELGRQTTIQMGDKDAIINSYHNLAKVGRSGDIEILTSRDVRQHHLRENVVCIGGPYWNKITLRFMQEIKSPYVFDFSDPDDDRTPMICCLSDKIYEAIWSKTRLCRDYGFFARFCNPFNSDRHVILACGIETQAVAGIVQAFSEEQVEFLRLHNKIAFGLVGDEDLPTEFPDFFCLMPFDVEDTGAVHLPSGEDQVACIVFNWLGGHSGRLQETPKD
ncbi:MAG: hypothetical protein H8D45_26695 [Bacteroidetes bacterium]|nr:hypothetical protein [Bacteroidota bacterium]